MMSPDTQMATHPVPKFQKNTHLASFPLSISTNLSQPMLLTHKHMHKIQSNNPTNYRQNQLKPQKMV